MAGEDGVVIVTSEQIYTLLLSIDKKVDRVEGKVDRVEVAALITQRTVEDHEIRLRSVEAHGSIKAQDNEKELINVRGRLHAVENSAALNAMALEQQREATGEKITAERVEREASRDTLRRLAFLALGTAASALIAIVVSLVAH